MFFICVFNSMTDVSAGGESQGGVMEASGRHLEAEDGLFMPEPDRASLHDSEGLLMYTPHGLKQKNSRY